MAKFYSEGVYRIGGGVSVPRLLTTRQPKYTTEARAAGIEGQVDLLITVGEDGCSRDIRIERPLGYGLDEMAIECVRKWRFSPGLKDGEAVPVAADVSVGFSLSGRFGTELRKALRRWTASFR